MIDKQYRFKIFAFFTLLLVLDWFLYFRHAGHFFQGDTVFLLNHRATSVTEFLKEFIQLNPSGWYRPLANELVESLFYPLAGLNPIPYRIPVYAVFIAITGAVYALVLVLSRRHLAAALAAVFFSIHSINAYTTYDLGFMPELLFTYFYLLAILAYLQYLETESVAAYRLSLVFFIASLLSKEAAVTLPGALFVTGMVFDPATSQFRKRLVGTLRSIAPHMLVLAAYLAFGVGYLKIQDFSITTLLDSTQTPSEGDYVPVLNGGVGKNADLALSWAFNIPRGSWGRWRDLEPAMVTYLKLFRVLTFALIAVTLFMPERRLIFFGSVWFWITLIPALPLVSHFLPYYLFLPIIGLSLVVGVIFAWLYDRLAHIQPLLAGTVIVLVFAGTLYATSQGIGAEIRSNPLLGGSASLAENTLNDLKRRYPALPPDATVYFADAGQSLAWVHDFGGLIKMAYGTNRFATLYESQGDALFPDTPKVLLFEVDNGHLIDQSERYRTMPWRYLKFDESEFKLELSATKVIAGKDQYTLKIDQLKNTPVHIAYTLNGGPLQIFTAGFDAEGKVTLDVSQNTGKGVYRFWGFRAEGAPTWSRAEHALTVQ